MHVANRKISVKNQTPNNNKHNKVPWKLIGQILLALAFFYILGWMVTSLSFTGRNGDKILATQEVSAEEIFDNFGFKVFDVKWNEATWAEVGSGTQAQQLDGILTLTREKNGSGGLVAHRRKWLLSQISHAEARLMLGSDIQTQAGEIGIEIYTTGDTDQWFVRCAIHSGQNEEAAFILCETADAFSTTPVTVPYDTWHLVRFEVDPENIALTFFVDGQETGKYIAPEKNDLNQAEYLFMLEAASSSDGSLRGSFDHVLLKNR